MRALAITNPISVANPAFSAGVGAPMAHIFLLGKQADGSHVILRAKQADGSYKNLSGKVA
jgi:hypothetical protein